MREPTTPFLVGDQVTVRPTACTLEVNGEPRRIDWKAMQVLLLLADSPGSTVRKETLFDRVWNGAAVTDDVLTGAVVTLRRALDDDARKPTFIQTIPREGYRLIAPVADLPPAPPPARRRAALAITAVAIVIAALLAVVVPSWRSSVPEPRVEALAVLPLASIAEGDERYLAEGMTDSLTTALGRLEDLAVISRTSAQRLSERARPWPEVAAALHVDAVVEGSIQRHGDDLRVSLQLIDTATDRVRWAGAFDGTLAEVLALQHRVATALSAQVRRSQVPSQPPVPVDAAAYDAYLRGRYLALGHTLAEVRRATEAFEQVVAAEPDFAPAHIALAETRLRLAREPYGDNTTHFAAARRSAVRAVALDPTNGRAHAALATVDLLHDWSFDDAERRFERALALAPSHAEARRAYAELLTLRGDFEAAIDQVRWVRELDPLAYSRPQAAAILAAARQLEPALAELDAQLEVEPDAAPLHLQRALVLAQAERPREAVSAYQAHVRLLGDHRQAEAAGAAFEQDGLAGVYGIILAQLERAAARGATIPAVELAQVRLGAGDVDGAFAALERALERRDHRLLGVVHDPAFDPLRSDVRFASLLRRMGLPARAS